MVGQKSVRLVLLPGLGADAALFGPQAAVFPELVVPSWIPPWPHEELSTYAGRLAETIEVSRPLVLGGVSLGGMIAYEMARHLRPEALVLVASCRRRQSLPRGQGLLRWLARWLPVAVFEPAKRLSPAFPWWWGRCDTPERRLLVEMFRRADSRFMHWALGAIFSWDPSPPPELPIHQIHGRRDRLIPAARTPADCYVADGGHMINLTHAEQVNAFLGEVVRRQLP